MRAPSPQLLRALRSAVTTTETSISTSTSTSTSIPACIRTRRISTSPSRLQSQPQVHPQHLTNRTTPAAATQLRQGNRFAPASKDRGPTSSEDTQTDFGAMDVLGHIPAPATSIDACTSDGFHLDNGVKTEGGRGIMLLGGEAFNWAPWTALSKDSSNNQNTLNTQSDGAETRISDLLDPQRGILNIPISSLSLLELVHPKPDLLIIGTGARLWMLSSEVRKYLSEKLGCRIDTMDTGNAASAYNLLAKERGVEGGAGVGALLLPVGWRGPLQKGRKSGVR